MLCRIQEKEWSFSMSEYIVVFVAIVVALIMAIKPEMFVINEARRTPGFIKALKGIGLSVCIVLVAMLIINLMS